MNTFLKTITLGLALLGFSTSASALVWGEGNWGENWGAEQARDPVPPPEGPVPVAPKIRSISGGETDAAISAGAYADNGAPTYASDFTTGDYITIIAEITPDSADVGSNGELVVVLLSVISGQVQWSFLNVDGNFETWDLKIGTLGAAEVVEPLEASHSITIFEGELQAGKHRMAVGYVTSVGKLIYTAKAINIDVSDG